ncbi:hypothetical protein RKD28_004889 [Streptomyces sp. SAI-229]
MTSHDRTPASTESVSAESRVRPRPWVPILTTVASLAAALVLTFTGHSEVAVAAVAATGAAGAVRITVHVRR